METKSFRDIVNSNVPVVIDFYASWCSPCKAMSPILENLKSRMGEQIRIIKIDVDDNRDIATQLDIHNVPTLMIFQNGEKKWKKIGMSSVAEIESVISQLKLN